MTPVLELRGLSKSYPIRNGLGRISGAVRAVDNVSLSIPQGQVYGLAGESGSGKSTIARMIMGLTAPDAGQILLDGQPVTALNRRQIQMVFQNPGASLNPRRTVAQSIKVPLVANGMEWKDRKSVG